ncbi:hypothetical protein MLD38_010679 [Melastoma candidum]|uniref:Uncharacterized protein n=1 Tax=Melastoma candidum TaxID=119954 RepID=A0ACB9R0M7_9MYRT|nr:hypothetical protein MLD38_010679 [Melastoma candidum]
MASNPPFEMEDQTDEDFFDKLVDDDDFGVTKLPVLSERFGKLSVGSNRDEDGFEVEREDNEAGAGEATVQAHLPDAVDDASVPSLPQNSSGLDFSAFFNDKVGGLAVDSSDGVEGEDMVVNEDDADVSAAWGEINDFDDSLPTTTNSGGFEGSVESIAGCLGTDSTVGGVSKVGSSGSGGGIKEVGWSSFYADTGDQGGSQGNWSDADFFSEINSAVAGEGFPGSLGGHSYDNRLMSSGIDSQSNGLEVSVNHLHANGELANQVEQVQNPYLQDLSSSNYWENTYPGWAYDAATGQWYPAEGYDANATVQADSGNSVAENWNDTSNGMMDASYLQQAAQSVAGTVVESVMTENILLVDQVTDVNAGYPEHMVFDAQYPGWYYDTIKQEWCSLESYETSLQSSTQSQNQQNHDRSLITDAHAHGQNDVYSDYSQTDSYGLQNNVNKKQDAQWHGSYNDYNQQSMANSWHAGTFSSSTGVAWVGNQYSGGFGSEFSHGSSLNRPSSVGSFSVVESYDKPSGSLVEAHKPLASASFFQDQPYSQTNFQHTKNGRLSNDYYHGQKPMNYGMQTLQSGSQFSQVHSSGRSSAGRPAHALVTFGFGGKLVVLKDTNSSVNLSYGGQDPSGYSISVLNLTEVFQRKDDNTGASSYTRALCQHSFPGPLVGGSVGTKDLNKWIDERIANCDSPDVDYRKAENLKLLLSLLKVACQHYGKLRSPFGSEPGLKEGDSPESAVAQIFASAKKNSSVFGSPLSCCFQFLPAAEQIQATASEVQNLLVSGRRKEALQCAQAGQLWGPALILASQLGDQFYVDTVKQMALTQMVPGSPLRTLCLLIAGQPAEVFSAEAAPTNGMQPSGIMSPSKTQSGTKGMLEDWKENLAIITANRTKDDELVIIHLGDCLWKERGEITAAHICYLVAEANFESYSDTARLCIVGADHWKCPRTYASPEAIERTELYEYSKVLGNSQFTLQPFQPYKIIYAHMLAEVGKISDSLKYCQAISKSLKNGRAPEVEMWKQVISSLEERIRMHQQGGYSANLAPGKIVGKLLNFFDNTAHRVVGGLPPPVPTTSYTAPHGMEQFHQPLVTKVSGSQSTMAMSSLMPSDSMEPISEWAGNDNGSKMRGHNRSVSEPTFGMTPKQGDGDSSNEMHSENAPAKGPVSGRASRFPRFGFGSQILQKTVGLVLRPRNDKQAKLGEANKFYYDEKLKRWVEEGAEPPAEETALAPPPTTATFQNGLPDGSPEFNSPSISGPSSGIPPIPPSSNQFSASGRMGVRSRYVDTFNKGGGNPAHLFQSPSVPAAKPAVAANAKFFVPAPVMSPSNDPTMEAITENLQEETATSEDFSNPSPYDPYKSPLASASPNMPRFPSMGSIPSKSPMASENGPFPSHSRRTASWSGSFNEVSYPPKQPADGKLPVETLGTSSPSDMMQMYRNGSGSVGDELDESRSLVIVSATREKSRLHDTEADKCSPCNITVMV